MRRGRKPASSIDERVEKQKLIVLKDKDNWIEMICRH